MENWWNWPQIHCLSCTLRQKICRYSECRIWFFMKKVSTSSEQKKKHGSTWATSQDNWNDYEQWWGQNQTKSFYNDIKTNMIDLCCEFLIERPFRINYLCQEKELTKHVLVHMEISLFLKNSCCTGQLENFQCLTQLGYTLIWRVWWSWERQAFVQIIQI